MPALEMAQDTALLVRWAKHEGEHVSKGDVLMEIETDKATVEIEATGSGILSRVTARAGEQVPVGRVIAVLLDEAARSSSDETSVPRVDSGPEKQSPIAASEGIKLNPLRMKEPPSQKQMSPKARRLAREHGLNLSDVVASGTGQAVHASDILKMLSPRADSATHAEYTALPLKGKRRVIAERTQKSYQTAPHISLSLSIDVSSAQALIQLARLTARDDGAACPNFTGVLLKAAAEALNRHPSLNAHFVNDEVREYRDIDLGVAVAVPDGLLVPVIRNAGQRSTIEICHTLEDLVTRARNGRLRLEEMTGSTFTVSNLGMFGVEHFSAILNPPEVAILSVGGIVERAVKNEGRMEFRPFIQATINVDHRAIDGAGAATYLQTLKTLLEQPQFIY
jgi:pyruvate dehydrogenase E2 component (dihydrolipoamide acetyltransferase)